MDLEQKSQRKGYLTGRQVGFLQFPYSFWQKDPPDVHLATCFIYPQQCLISFPLIYGIVLYKLA